jgi:uncharacterized Zn finger protein (UPF0148 family)
MGFLVYCDNKGCGKDQEPLLDLETNEVVCRECSKPIKSVTPFAKAQMKALGQIKRQTQRQEAFSVKCATCQKQGQPKLNEQGQIICSFCRKEMTEIPKPFQQVIKTNLRAQK